MQKSNPSFNNEMIQGSAQWHELRRLSIGASDASTIVGENPWKTIHQLWEEKVEGKEVPINDAMRRGSMMESQARRWCEEELACDLLPTMAFHSEHQFMHASLDGYSHSRGICVEIKCPGIKTHNLAKDGNIPKYYQWQMQHTMEVLGIEMMYYCSFMTYTDAVLIPYHRNQDMIDLLIMEEDKFYRMNMVRGEEPDLCDKDYYDFSDENEELKSKLSSNFSLLELLRNDIKRMQEAEENIREQIVKIANGRNIRLNDHKATKYRVKGTVKYSDIPEMKNVDLELYRKEPTIRWRIT